MYFCVTIRIDLVAIKKQQVITKQITKPKNYVTLSAIKKVHEPTKKMSTNLKTKKEDVIEENWLIWGKIRQLSNSPPFFVFMTNNFPKAP